MGESISIITPSLNQGRFIERTIRSVLDQEVPNLEYWTIDGGSDDDTIEILERFDSRLSWVSEADNGQAAAVNKGIAKSAGEIIGWLNSDDIYYPGAVREVMDYFSAHPEANLVYGDANHIDEHDEVIERYGTEGWEPQRLREVCFLCQPAVFFRRNLVECYGYLDENLDFCMDYEYWLRLSLGGEDFHYLPELLAGSRFYPENKTLRDRPKVHSETNNMMLRKLGRVPEAWLFSFAHAYVDSKGYKRENKWRYAVAVSAVSLYASLRWNRGISREVYRKTLHWTLSNSWKSLKNLPRVVMETTDDPEQSSRPATGSGP